MPKGFLDVQVRTSMVRIELAVKQAQVSKASVLPTEVRKRAKDDLYTVRYLTIFSRRRIANDDET